MKKIFVLAVVALAACLFTTQQAHAQTQQPSTTQKVLNAVSDFIYGESQSNSYYNAKTKHKVNISLSDLSVTDKMTYSSIYTAFKGNEDLELADINFAPDFKDGYFYLSFSSQNDEPTKVVILDVKGTEIHNETIEDFSGTYESRINIPVEKTGTYFLKVIQGFSLLNKKLVIE